VSTHPAGRDKLPAQQALKSFIGKMRLNMSGGVSWRIQRPENPWVRI
jgi:hypothetical protein